MGTPGSIKPKQIGKVIVYSVIFIMIVFAAGMLITRIPTSTKQEDVKSSSKIIGVQITKFVAQHIERSDDHPTSRYLCCRKRIGGKQKLLQQLELVLMEGIIDAEEFLAV